MSPSPANSITKDEFIHWLKSVFFFSLPALSAFLVALQVSATHGKILPDGQDLIFAFGAFYSAFLCALIGLIKTYNQDNTK